MNDWMVIIEGSGPPPDAEAVCEMLRERGWGDHDRVEVIAGHASIIEILRQNGR